MIIRKELEKEVAEQLRDLELEEMKIEMLLEDRLSTLIKKSMLKKCDLELLSVKSIYHLTLVKVRHPNTNIGGTDILKIRNEVSDIPMEKLQETITEILEQFQHTFKQVDYSLPKMKRQTYKYDDDFQLDVKLT